MTSISPHAGHPAESMSPPRSQKAGQIPCPSGSWMRASKRPYVVSKSPWVLMRADV